MSLDNLCIDGVVLLVRADELDENDPVRVVDGRDQSVLVAGDIEDHAPVRQDARSTEVGLEDMAMPGKKWLLRVGILRSFVEGPKGR